jgi:hypothetical protein
MASIATGTYSLVTSRADANRAGAFFMAHPDPLHISTR